MAVYKPKRKGVESKYYVYEFVYQGKRFQGSTGATTRTLAREHEKQRRAELERAAAGLPSESKTQRIRTVAEVIKPYLEDYKLSHQPKSILFASGRLAQVEKVLGPVLLSDLTEARIRDYMRERKAHEISGRTINMEVGELSRAMGHKWSELWPKVKKLKEHKDVGKALAASQQTTLLKGLEDSRSPILRAVVPMLLLTGMRPGEATTLLWRQIDMLERKLTVGDAKSEAGTGRIIPINSDLARVIAKHRAWFIEQFGEPKPNHCVFPFGHPVPSDPFRPVTDITWAWDELRDRTKVRCRLHDLRHTFATSLAERGVPESTMLALMGHMSRAMLERYSHIRMTAKRTALDGITLWPKEEIPEGVPVKVPVPDMVSKIQ